MYRDVLRQVRCTKCIGDNEEWEQVNENGEVGMRYFIHFFIISWELGEKIKKVLLLILSLSPCPKDTGLGKNTLTSMQEYTQKQ